LEDVKTTAALKEYASMAPLASVTRVGVVWIVLFQACMHRTAQRIARAMVCAQMAHVFAILAGTELTAPRQILRFYAQIIAHQGRGLGETARACVMQAAFWATLCHAIWTVLGKALVWMEAVHAMSVSLVWAAKLSILQEPMEHLVWIIVLVTGHVRMAHACAISVGRTRIVQDFALWERRAAFGTAQITALAWTIPVFVILDI
jgi:hypothetical protein